jgi:hypothetical protein
MATNINGPTNYACLKGKINGIEKKIYLFMDTHYELDEQTRYDTFDSIDISHYLYDKIKNTTDELDFFLEIEMDEIKNKQTNKRDIYIKDTMELFKSEFVVEKINNTDMVRYSKSNPKVRLHYLDIRDSMDIGKIRYIIKHKIREQIKLLAITKENEIRTIIVSNISKYLKKIQNFISKLVSDKDKAMYGNVDKDIKINDPQLYYINKIINRCADENLRINLIIFLENNFTKTLEDLNHAIKDILIPLNNFFDLDIDKIIRYVDFIDETSLDLYSLFIDCFLLRRILDKNYIKKIITYTGSQHSINYIYFLVKYYNFRIEKIFHLEKNLSDLINQIVDTNYVLYIYRFFISNKKIYPQCTYYEPMIGGRWLHEK